MPQNYLNAFRAPDLAGIDRAAYSNALLRNEVQRLPQRNAAEDQAIQAEQQNVAQSRVDNARKTAAGIFGAIADSPDPIGTAQMLTQSELFRSVGAELK